MNNLESYHRSVCCLFSRHVIMFSLKLEALFEFGRKENRNTINMLTYEIAFFSSSEKDRFYFLL